MPEQFNLFSESQSKDDEKKTDEVDGIRVLYFDLETQKSADEVGGWENAHQMKLLTILMKSS